MTFQYRWKLSPKTSISKSSWRTTCTASDSASLTQWRSWWNTTKRRPSLPANRATNSTWSRLWLPPDPSRKNIQLTRTTLLDRLGISSIPWKGGTGREGQWHSRSFARKLSHFIEGHAQCIKIQCLDHRWCNVFWCQHVLELKTRSFVNIFFSLISKMYCSFVLELPCQFF